MSRRRCHKRLLAVPRREIKEGEKGGARREAALTMGGHSPRFPLVASRGLPSLVSRLESGGVDLWRKTLRTTAASHMALEKDRRIPKSIVHALIRPEGCARMLAGPKIGGQSGTPPVSIHRSGPPSGSRVVRPAPRAADKPGEGNQDPPKQREEDGHGPGIAAT